MSYTAKPLGDGQLTNSSAAVYTVPTGFRATIENLTFFNTDASSHTIQVHVDDGTSRQMFQQALPTKERVVVIDANTPIHMNAGDILKAHDDAGSVVNYFVYGREEQAG